MLNRNRTPVVWLWLYGSLAQGFHKIVVSAIMEVTTYGSMFEAGLLSSKYPFPSFSVSLPTRTDAPRFATPYLNEERLKNENIKPLRYL